jgi:hypothetical protein
MSFGVILCNEKINIGLKKLFVLITPTQEFGCWRGQFYRIGSWLQKNIKMFLMFEMSGYF